MVIEHVETESCASDPSEALPNEAWCAPPAVHLQIIAPSSSSRTHVHSPAQRCTAPQTDLGTVWEK